MDIKVGGADINKGGHRIIITETNGGDLTRCLTMGLDIVNTREGRFYRLSTLNLFDSCEDVAVFSRIWGKRTTFSRKI